jgi:hypothetical protein
MMKEEHCKALNLDDNSDNRLVPAPFSTPTIYGVFDSPAPSAREGSEAHYVHTDSPNRAIG